MLGNWNLETKNFESNFKYLDTRHSIKNKICATLLIVYLYLYSASIILHLLLRITLKICWSAFHPWSVVKANRFFEKCAINFAKIMSVQKSSIILFHTKTPVFTFTQIFQRVNLIRLPIIEMPVIDTCRVSNLWLKSVKSILHVT